MAPPLITLRGVRLVDGPRMLLDGVDLQLEKGARACLVGRNGAGKSTLLRILAGLAEPDDGERIVRPGLKIAMLAQEPAIDGETLGAWVMKGGVAAHAADAALESFGLDPRRPTAGLSGGEARRAALARAFAGDPDVLLLDEPTNHLDILAIEALEARVGRTRAAVLAVSHDRAFLERTTAACFWLEGRRLRRLDRGFEHFEAWAEEVLAAEAESARRLEVSVAREERWLAYGVTGRRARNEGRRRRLQALRAEKAEVLAQTRGEMRIGPAAAPRSGRLVAEAKGIAKSLGGRTLIAGFSTRVQRGDRVAIVGPNGAGKSTLVGLLLGRIAPDRGTVRLGSGLEIAHVSQDRAELDPERTLADILAPGGGDQILVGGRPRHVAGYAADFLFRDDQLRQPVRSLSGGERNRLLLAAALAKPSNLLVLDEPTNDLDVHTLDLIEDWLADYRGTLILVSHDRDFIERLASSTIALDGRGRVVETPGGWSDFIAQNPGFFAPAERRETPRATPARPGRPASKLSFKEARRLAELEAEAHRLADRIARLEAGLAEPDFYARDPQAFARAAEEIVALRAALDSAEQAWLELEARREALARMEGRPLNNS
jgi:ATP-binding cassette subfamily F protein uup